MDTLFLDPQTWDLVLDSSGNIAMANNPYSLAQDAASAIKVFLGEVYYDTTQGLPYFGQILGHLPPLELLKAQMVAAALTVPGVIAATVFVTEMTDRLLRGQVQITDNQNNVLAIGF